MAAKRTDDWYYCEACETNFGLRSDTIEIPEYCPFCGSELTYESDDDELDDEDY